MNVHTFKIGAAVVIMDADNKILLGKRKNTIGAGEWGLPGGHLKPGETIQECLKREVQNEVGINLMNIGLLDVSDMVETHEAYELVEIGYACNTWEGLISLKECKYISEWQFFDLERVPHELFLPHQPFIYKIIKQMRGDDKTDENVGSLLNTIYPHFKINVECFVLDKENRLLMGLRCDEFDGGNWAVPGGHLDVGETLAECALRELEEETGLEAGVAQQFACVEQPITLSNQHYIHFGYLIKDFEEKELVIGEAEDFSKWEWIALDKVPANLAPSQREMILRFLKLNHFSFGKK